MTTLTAPDDQWRPSGQICVDICVCTYRRASLEATLESIAHQSAPPKVSYRVIVSDNDETPSAKSLVEAAAQRLGLSISYVHAPAQNISIARNACLDAVRAPLLAFLDDDEIASPGWLAGLLAAKNRTDADVVFGPVDAVYEADAPAWMRRTSIHSIRPVWVGGDKIVTGYTCNVLISHAAVGALRFDPQLGRSGGEDTWFFHQMTTNGAQFDFAPSALATEAVPPARARFDWLAKRSFRTGQTHARILRSMRPHNRALMIAPAMKTIYCGALALVTLPIAERRNRALIRGALHLGVVSSLLGRRDLQLY